MGTVINFAEAGGRIRRRRLPVLRQLELQEIERGNTVSMSAEGSASFPAHLQKEIIQDLGMSVLILEDDFPSPTVPLLPSG